MNVYEKLNKAKLALQSAGLKKTGKNDFAKYSYFELGDFLPSIIGLESELGFHCQICFSDEAQLIITDTEKPTDQIMFTSPMSSASLKGMHDVQNLGAVQTYLRRYLYVNAFEIVEQDAIDKGHEPPKTATKTKQRINADQLKRLIDLCSKPDGSKDTEAAKKLKEVYSTCGFATANEITVDKYDEIVKAFEAGLLPFEMGE